MSVLLSNAGGYAAPRGLHVDSLSRLLALFAATFLAMLVSGCAVMWVSAYDKESVDRTTDISKSALKFYQDLMATEPGKRAAAVSGSLGQRHGDIESQIRLHLLREQARPRNIESTTIAGNLLESWQAFTASHRSANPSALSDAVLTIERGVIERHLRAAFIAEEAKKLGGGAAS